MARYNCVVTDGRGGVLDYLESTTDEDKLDMADDQVCIAFSGAGWLSFWKRCMDVKLDTPGAVGISFTDTWSGEERVTSRI